MLVSSGIQVYVSPLPFSNKREKVEVDFGSSIEQIVAQVAPLALLGKATAIVFINDHIVPKNVWHLVRPKPGTTVNIRVVPTGGGGKNPLTTILSIAVMIAAPYAAGLALGAMGVAASSIVYGTLTYGALMTAGVATVGLLAVTALAPPPKQPGGLSDPSQSPTQFIEGARNTINPFGGVPVCLGTNRMVPLQAARPYTETDAGRQFVRQLFTYGYGQQLVASDFRIGDTPMESYSNVDIEHRLNGDLHESTELYGNVVLQEDMNVLLTEADGFSLRTTQVDTDEVVIDFTFPQGLTGFNDNGRRTTRTVQLEVQYAPSGTEDWSPGATSFKTFSARQVAVTAVPRITRQNISYRRDIIVMDAITGAVSRIQGGNISHQPAIPVFPQLPVGKIKIADIVVSTNYAPVTPNTAISVQDTRNPELFGEQFENSSSFTPSVWGGIGAPAVNIAAGGLRVNFLIVRGAQTEALRHSVRIRMPERGQYDIRARRMTADTSSQSIIDRVNWTALRSIRHSAPVNLVGINGTAVRIQATDQLNGALDTFNALISNIIPDYNADADEWQPAQTSNPASIYLYVLQGAPNARPISSSKIDFEALQAWHAHCAEQGYTYNRVIDYDASVDDVLRDVASAGSASPAIIDGKRSIVVDMEKDNIVQLITPRNSWGYQGERIYPEMPHAFRVQFRNAAKGYIQDEIIVYDDGYGPHNATKFESIELQSCTNADLAFKTARRYIASIRLRPETHTFSMSVEYLQATRGDRIKFVNDVPMVGIGDGRIKSVTIESGMVTAISIDDTVTVPQPGIYFVRIRKADGTQLYKQLNTTQGMHKSFTFATPFDAVDAPAPGDLCAFTESGRELDLIITSIEPMDDLTARIRAVDYAPEIFEAENQPIPPFESNITMPVEFLRPLPPVVVEHQSDESVMLRNSDGTFMTRAIFTLQNRNGGDVTVLIRLRETGTTTFRPAQLLEATAEQAILTGLQDGTRYDVEFRYRRAGSNSLSAPTRMNGWTYIGASGLPADVQNFRINVTDNVAILTWDKNKDIDLSHYEIRFNAQFEGAAWGTAQVLEATVYENRITLPFQPGTYLIKAVDLTGNRSQNATAIITFDPGIVRNAVEQLVEDPTFSGIKDGVVMEPSGTSIRLGVGNSTGYYYFANAVNLDGLYTSFVSASVVANGIRANNIFAVADIFAMQNIFSTGGEDIFAMQNIYDVEDIFGIGADAWEVEVQYRITLTDPNDSPAAWTDWATLDAGNYEFWAIEFRLMMRSFEDGVVPRVTQLRALVDMPDRIERGEDMTLPAEGLAVTYDPPFRAPPAVTVTIQDGATDDRLEFINKDRHGFEIRVYNATDGAYVARVVDYISSGYGREEE